MTLPIIKNRKIWYSISLLLVVLSIAYIGARGVKLGIDFTGGSLLEIAYTTERVTPEQINEVLASNDVGAVVLQAAGEKGYLLRMPEISEETRRDIISGLQDQIGQTGAVNNSDVSIEAVSGSNGIALEGVEFDTIGGTESASNQLIERRFESIGPVIGQELRTKSVKAILIVLIAILLYVAWAFRKVSWPVKSWKYGIIALITLFHDVIITFGIFTLLTHIFGWELSSAFVAAILTILGYSVNDTIVVFDRIRENIPKLAGKFEDVVNTSVNQTLSRSINTSLTTSLVLLAIMIFGGETIRSFVTALFIGVILGTYSSIFIASPLLVTLKEYQEKAEKKK